MGEVVILDTKYKNLEADPRPSEADVYQVITYCVSHGSNRGILVYPTSGLIAPMTYEIANAGITLTCFPINLGHGPAELGGSVERLASFVRAI